MLSHKYQEHNISIELDKLLFQYNSREKIYRSNPCLTHHHGSICNNIEIKFKTILNKLEFLNTFQSIKIIGDCLGKEVTKSVNIIEIKNLILSAEPYIKLLLSENNGSIDQYIIIFETKNIFTLGKINLSLIYYTKQTHYRFIINKPNKIAFQKLPNPRYTSAPFYKEYGKFLNDLTCYYIAIQELPVLYQIRAWGDLVLGYIAIQTTTQNVCIIHNKANCYRISVIDTFGNERKFIDCFDIFEIDSRDINDGKISTPFVEDGICVFKKKKDIKLFFRFKQFNFDNSEYIRQSGVSNENTIQQIREKYNIDLIFLGYTMWKI